MTNEQYSNMMVAIAKLEAKIEKLEEMLKPPYLASSVKIESKDIRPEDLSRFWNEPPTFHPDVLIVEGKE